ncbi:MAG: ATP-binding protein [Steroidobacteraceae bacterium]
MASTSSAPASSHRVLVLAPAGADGAVIEQLLGEVDLEAVACSSFAQLSEELGGEAGAVLMTEEALFGDTPELLAEQLADQEPWSDLPLIAIVSPVNDAQWTEVLSNLFGTAGNLTLLERPCRAATLVSTVQVALRARRKQYQVRDLLKSEHAAWVKAEASLQQAQRSDAARKLNEERLHLAARTAGLGMWTVTLATRAMEFTELGKELFGFKPDEDITLEALRACIHPEDLAIVEGSLQEILASDHDYEVQCRVGSQQDGWRWLLVHGRLSRSWNGQPLHMTGVCQDITSRKQAEVMRERLLESERAARTEAERVTRMKDEFLATISHELRTPLNAITGWVAILRSGRVSPTDQTKGLEVIDRNTRLQAQLISDMLDMSRIISGKMRIDVHEVDLVNVIQSAIESIQPTLMAKNLRIDTDFDCMPCYTLGDGARLQQIMWNLLANAAKFTQAGGRIEVRLRKHAHAIDVEVADDGQGIDASFLPYLFDRFRQADSSNRRSHGGLGLGLSIVRHLVELHGGSVEAHSDGVGQGSRFRIHFPLQAALPQAPMESLFRRELPRAGAALEDGASLDGLHVLVVDDDADALDLAARILADSSARVSTASSVSEALVKLRDERPDLVISDVSMPERDGFDFVRSVRALSPSEGGETPMLALTALARASDRELALECGFDDHLTKPIEPAQLLNACRKIHRQGSELGDRHAATRMS